MRNRFFKAVNKLAAIILSVMLVTSMVNINIIDVNAVNETVMVKVTLTDSTSAPVNGATIKLMAVGEDDAPDTEVGAEWQETTDGVYTATVEVDTEKTYYVKASTGYDDAKSVPQQFVAGENSIALSVKTKVDTITVVVKDSAGSNPAIEHARVEVYKGENVEGTPLVPFITDESGIGSVSGTFVEGDSYTVKVSKDGYAPKIMTKTVETSDLAFDVMLDKIYPVTIVVKDEAGNPVTDATVTVKYDENNTESVSGDTEGAYVATGAILNSTVTYSVSKANYVSKTNATHTIDTDEEENKINVVLEHVKLYVEVSDNAITHEDLVLSEEKDENYVVVTEVNWASAGEKKYVTENVSTGKTYKVEVDKEGYYSTGSNGVTVSEDNINNVVTVSAQQFGQLKLNGMEVGSTIKLYKGSVEEANLVDEVVLTTDTYTFVDLVAADYIVTTGNYRESSPISVTSGNETEIDKADLWIEAELTIVTIGTAPTMTYDEKPVGDKVLVLNSSQTDTVQEFIIEPAANTIIVGLVYFDGTNYSSLISESSSEMLTLSDSGNSAFFGDEFSVNDTEKVLYVITDKVIDESKITVQFGESPDVSSFEKSELSVKINGANGVFGNIAEGYYLNQSVDNNPAVYAGDNNEFLSSTTSSTFDGGSVNFTNVAIGNYAYAFDFTVNISLKAASQVLSEEVLEELQGHVYPTVNKTTTVSVIEPKIVTEGINADVKISDGGIITGTEIENKYILNNNTLTVISTAENHGYDQYILNNGATEDVADDGIISLNEGENTLTLVRSTDGLTSAEYIFDLDTSSPTISGVKFEYKNSNKEPATLSLDYDKSDTVNSFDSILISVTAADVGLGIKSVELCGGGSILPMVEEPVDSGNFKYTLNNTGSRVSYYIKVTDEAGNVTNTATSVLSIDKTKPASSGPNYSGLTQIGDVWYGGTNATVSVTFTDAHLNLTTAGVQCSVPCSVSGSDDRVTVNISLGAGTYEGITVSCSDIGGNVSDPIRLGKIIVDPNAPQVSVALSSAQGSVENGGVIFYRGPVTASLSISDEAINEATIKSSLGTSLPSGGSEVISADGKYSYSVTAEDMSGNVGVSETKEFVIDATAPVATLSYDNESVYNESYYNAARVATFTVVDANFDVNATTITVDSTGANPVISQWTNVGGNTYQATVTFSADADYVMSFSCVDKAGNSSNAIETQEFTIDKTAPVISVSYDNNSVANGIYYKTVRNATIVIEEHNFVEEAVNITVTAANGVTPSISGWMKVGDVYTTSIAFANDDVYTLQISYTDIANNMATGYGLDRFVIDTVVPELSITGVENEAAYNGTVQPAITYSDTNLTDAITLTLVDSDGNEVDYSYNQTEADGLISILYDDFTRTKEVDNIYTLTVKVDDMAGNTVEQSVKFSVNRFGSTYEISDESKVVLGSILQNAQGITVTEVNVDPLEESKISYSLNGTVVELVKGTDYTVEERNMDALWKEYTYIINADSFAGEGSYILTFYSEDKAGNIQDNKVKGLDIEFIIDKTAPSIVISGIEDGEQYTEETKLVTLDVQDNLGVENVTVLVDGNEYVTFTKEDLAKDFGVVSFELAESSERQVIQVIATDSAGNSAPVEEISVLVTSNMFVQWYTNTPLMVGTIVGGVAVLGGGTAGVVSIRRRKRRIK